MNFVAIDPSLISTALVVNGKIFNYCRGSKVNLKNGMTKWYKSAEQYCNYRFIEFNEFEDYSEGEIVKLMDYDNITDKIIYDILDNIDDSVETFVGIEGYNFGSTVGMLIDLVAFSSILRKKIYDKITKNILILSPTSLKLEACKLTYKPIIKESGKRVKKIKEINQNNFGVSGGKFTKRDMCWSIIDNDVITHPWFEYIKSIKSEIMEPKDIQKPHEDINDAILIYFILRKIHL